jgi:hypothetical protein
MGLPASTAIGADLTASLRKGKVALESVGPLAFGPDGVLFAADPLAAALHAIDTGDRQRDAAAKPLRVEGIDRQVAAVLGTSPQETRIVDLAVNPASGNAYLAVARGAAPNSPGVLVRVDRAGKLEALSLEDVKCASVTLTAVPAKGASSGEGGGRRQREDPRLQSITDLAYVDGRVLVAGMSNEEFASSLRSIPFPFDKVGEPASIEIYHGAHGKFETHSPVRTFIPLDVAGEQHILAAYQCTPLVSIPFTDLRPGAKIRGKTVAELGNRNRPLDMVVYKKGQDEFILIANNSRGVMKIDTTDLEKGYSVSAPVRDGKREGVPYETVEAWKGIHQLDLADDKNALVVRQGEDGAFHLETLPLP